MREKKSLFAALSLGVVLIGIHIWMLSQADILFPQNTEQWRIRLLTYTALVAFVFAFDAVSSRETEQSLFTANFIKSFPLFLISAVATFLILLALGAIIKQGSLPSIQEALSRVNFAVLLLHAFVVAIGEELIFRGFLVNELRRSGAGNRTVQWTQAFAFTGFHFSASGGEWRLMIIYIPLALLWLYLRDRFSPKTNMANAGSHFGWNAFILGFIR